MSRSDADHDHPRLPDREDGERVTDVGNVEDGAGLAALVEGERPGVGRLVGVALRLEERARPNWSRPIEAMR